MKVGEVIKRLEATYASEEEIIVAWWDKEWFELLIDKKISQEEWDAILSEVEEAMEYLDTGDMLLLASERALEKINKQEKETNDKKEKQ